ncbi:hypothetical protein [Sciscionella marina]|nr:hypothetical protein [Sciscionella marina]
MPDPNRLPHGIKALAGYDNCNNPGRPAEARSKAVWRHRGHLR